MIQFRPIKNTPVVAATLMTPIQIAATCHPSSMRRVTGAPAALEMERLPSRSTVRTSASEDPGAPANSSPSVTQEAVWLFMLLVLISAAVNDAAASAPATQNHLVEKGR